MTQKILVVEDDPVFRNYLYQVLKYDFDVVTAAGPLEALDALEQNEFGLMITDLRMPDMDGRALVEKVHSELDPNIMVIVITAYEDDWPMDIAVSSNVFRYLRKGAFLPSELKQNVLKAFEMRGSIVSLEEYKKRVDITEALYKDVFDKYTDALIITDVDLRPVAVNERFEELSGYSLDDLKNKTLTDIIDDSDRKQAIQVFDEQIAGGPPGSITVHFLKKDDTKRHVRVWARLVSGVHDMSNAVFCIVKDIEGLDEKRPKKAAGVGKELKEKTKELDTLKDHFQRLTDHAKDIIIWLDKDFTCEYVNAEVTRTLGYSPKDFLGKKIPWKDIVHVDDYPLVKQWQEAAQNNVSDMEGEIRVYTKTRYMLYLSYRLSLQYGQDGSFSSLDIVAEDITQQKIAEQEVKRANKKILEFNDRLTNGVSKKIKELRESEERYKQIVEDSHDIIFSIDTDARIVYMNRRGLQVLKTTHNDIYLKPCRDFMSDEASENKLQDMIEQITSGTSPEPFDISIETPQGKRIFRTTLDQIGDNSRTEYVCVARDISEDITKSKRLQQLSDIEHYSADAIIGLDAEGNIVSWNQGAYMIFGWAEDEAIGKSTLMIISDQGMKEVEDVLDEVRQKGFVKDRETQGKTKAGQILDISLTITELKGSAGRSSGFLGIIKDLTEKKKMEVALIQSERLAATGKLSASIAHEINNPLYGIRSCLNHVLGAKDDGVDLQFVRLAIKETDRIADLIRNMKTFYMPNEGGARNIDINETLRDVFMLNRKYLEEHMVKLRFSPEESYHIECVPDQIKQVFINLITNAVEAMPEGGELFVGTQKSEEDTTVSTVSIVFRDTGVGIANDDLPQIFDMFYSKKHMVKAVGLGLSVSYGIIKQHGGSIDVESEEGKGTIFTVTLPVKSLWARQMQLDLK
jgi:PAS domain S-box-containing protein